ncbi:helix-turn-helix domain-containing protein [bacterium]|nr:helix-turn-helix domain-containing protein [bacterium]MBU1651366.1 helix-turn-helix domain-containing protein [bacterium]
MPDQRSNINMAVPLKYWRTKRGYSQTKLAELSDTSALTISQLESSKRKARGKTLGKILDGLKVTRNEFFAMREATEGGTIPPESSSTALMDAAGAEMPSREATHLRLSNLDLELLNRILNLDFDNKLETLRFLQSIRER